MPCYNPMLAIKDYDSGLTDLGKFRFKLCGKYDPYYREMYPVGDVIKVPCGKCLGCRLDYSRKWADRMFLEFISQDKKGIFVTLTYNQDHVPFVCDDNGELIGYELCKRDVQLFFKRLRREFPKKHIRYYLSGEYGGKTHRPHYHAIIFGLSLKDFDDLKVQGKNELDQYFFISEKFQKIWSDNDGKPIGYHSIADVSYKTCAYVSRYTMKKAYNINEDTKFAKEFSLMSRRPGIAGEYFKDNPDVIEKKHIYFNDGQSQYSVSVPRYFLDKLKLQDQDVYDNLMRERRSLSSDKEMLELSKTDLSYTEYLEMKEEELFNKTKILFKRREEVLD